MDSAINQCNNATASGAADATRPAVRGNVDKCTTRIHATASGAADASNPAVRGNGEKSSTRTLNILQLNINGTQRKIDELSDILHRGNIHVACLQETRLNPNLKFNIKGYTTIRKDREDRSGGGLAFLIKSKEIKYKTNPAATSKNLNSNTEAQCIDILLPQHSVRIVNVYHPDNTEINVEHIGDLIDSRADTKLILGDFNARSPSWGSSTMDRKGLQIEELLDDIGFSVLNDGKMTYVSKTNGAAAALDVTTINHQSEMLTSWTVLESAISDHLPVLTSVDLTLDETKQNKRSWNFRKADWPKFAATLEELCNSNIAKSALCDRLSSFTSYVHKAAKCSIPRGKRRSDWVPFWKDSGIEELISERDVMCAVVQENNTAANREKYIELCHKVEEEISSCKRKKWESFCETLDPRKFSQHWNIIKVLNNQVTGQNQQPPTNNSISCRGEYARTDLDTATMLAKHFANNSRLSFEKTDKSVIKTTRNLIKSACRSFNNDIFTNTFTMDELNSAISKVDPKKAPGADLIFGSMIQHFGDNAKVRLLDIFNLSWITGKLPPIWKTSIIIPILKPNKKASDCNSYRPISLTSALCKLMERMIHFRLMHWLIEQKKINFYQTAYQAKHSTTDQLFYLCQSIIDGFQEKPPKKTTAVFLDLSAAFDRVWRQRLVNIIHNTGIKGNALIWINDFLRDRHFSVRVNGVHSKTHKSWAGVPQGSVLSPLLFLLYMNTIDSHIQPDTRVACYADDIAIWNTNQNIKVSEKSLNLTLKGISRWAEDLKLTINPSKSNFCIFSTDRKHRGSLNLDIELNYDRIERVSHPKYLGVTLDPELRFTMHLQNTASKAIKKLNILRRLCGTNWGSRSSTLRSTYCSIIRPVLEYSSPIWAPALVTNTNKLDSIQYRASKIIIGAVSSTNNINAERESGLIPLNKRRMLATVKFTNKLRSCSNNHISNRAFKSWTTKERLHRSSTLHFDRDVRKDISLEHSSLDILPEPALPVEPPSNTTFNLNLLQPCSKKEPTQILLRKGIDTINSLSQQNKVIIFTDGSSDNSFSRGGAGIVISHPSGERTELKIPTGQIASNFSSELIAIREALSFFLQHYPADSSEGLVIFSDSRSALEAIRNGYTNLTQTINNLLLRIGKPCTFQWIPAHVGIDGNESADILAKEARDLVQSNIVTSEDADAVARSRLFKNSFKKPTIPDLNCPRNLSSIIARLRTGHFKDMKIAPDRTRAYPICKHCPETQLTPHHFYSCRAISAALFLNFGFSSPEELLYGPNAPKFAELVLKTFGSV